MIHVDVPVSGIINSSRMSHQNTLIGSFLCALVHAPWPMCKASALASLRSLTHHLALLASFPPAVPAPSPARLCAHLACSRCLLSHLLVSPLRLASPSRLLSSSRLLV